METDRKWVVVRIDGKIAAVSTDYRMLAEITARLAQKKNPSQQKYPIYNKVCAEAVSFEEIWELRKTVVWEDLMLFGTEFQKKVWRKLFELRSSEERSRLISYSDFADICQNKAGVRAVAHAIGLNPVSIIIPCHLVIPKESVDKMAEIRKKAEPTIFKGDDICMESVLKDKGIDFGEYALGRDLKRRLIQLELG